uniref:Pentatricopeptide repeat-containing protein n=1 Tax=Kalanchoe fedtschenkoi TaxID=63787 RepID=A0A7N0T5V3_KALFE
MRCILPSLSRHQTQTTLLSTAASQPSYDAAAADWTKTIHRLCAADRDVDRALRLLDRLRLLRGYSPNSLNVSSIIHALCAARRFPEAHHRLLLFIASGSLPDERTSNVLIARLLDANLPDSTFRVVRGLLSGHPDFAPSLVNYNRLMHQFCCVGPRPQRAHGLFFDMVGRGHCPNTVSYTTLIDGYCKAGDLDSAHKVFDEMLENGVSANSLTYSVLIGGLLRKRDVEGARSLITELWATMDAEEDVTVKIGAFGNLVDSLCLHGFFQEVFKIAEDMPLQGPAPAIDEKSAYEQMIDSLCRYGRSHGAARIVYVMKKRGYVPSSVLYSSIIHGLCIESGGCMRAYQLLCEGSQWGFVPSEIAYMILVQELCRENDLSKAQEVVRVMLNKGGVDGTRIYNIYLRAVCLMNNPTAELLNALLHMLQTGFQPDLLTLNTVVNGLCKNGRVEDALKVLEDMISGKFCAPDNVTFSSIICGLLIVGRSNEALDLLLCRMPERGLHPTVATYNGLLCGLLKLHLANDAMEIFRTMQTKNVTADSTTHAIIIQGLCDMNLVEEAKRFWDEVVWPSATHDHFVYSAILKGLCRSGKFNDACDFLYELVDCGVIPNNVNYNIVIDGACKSGLKRDAYQILGEMRRNGLNPDACTWRILDKLHRSSEKKLPIFVVETSDAQRMVKT